MDEPLADDEPDREVNPFAPTATLPSADRLTRVNLPVHFWGAVAGSLLLFVVLAFFLPGFGVPAVMALVAATIRVPCLQRRRLAANPEKVLPDPILLLATSWVFVLVAGIAAVLTFMVICIPSGIAIGNGGTALLLIVFGLSGLIALGAFVWLFYLSLRLPV